MAHKIPADAQEAIATAKYIRMSPTKARQVIDLIRGRHVDDARRVLKFNARSASTEVGKVLESAIANAEHNRALPSDELVVVRAWADEGPTLKRFRPRAQGRASRIRKRTCHISVVVGRPEHLDLAPPVVEEKPRRRSKGESASGRAGGSESQAGGNKKKATDEGTSETSKKKTGEEASSEPAATVKQTKAKVKKDSGAETKPKNTAASKASPATEATPEKTSKTEGEEA